MTISVTMRLFSVCLSIALLCPVIQAADGPAEEQPTKDETPAPKSNLAKQEQQAIEFARNQHPELADLLDKLKAANPKQYQQALKELHAAEQRLARLREKDPATFDQELALWKIESRIRLLVAQMSMEDDEALDDSLKALLAERRELKRQALERERERAAKRLAVVDRQIEELESDSEAYTKKELKRLKQSVKRAKPGKGKAKREKADAPKPAGSSQ